MYQKTEQLSEHKQVICVLILQSAGICLSRILKVNLLMVIIKPTFC